MIKLEMVRRVLAETGDASAEQLSMAVQRRFGVRIEPRFIPLFRASLRDQQGRLDRRQTLQLAPVLTRGIIPATPWVGLAQELALELMQRHGLFDWHFAFNRQKQTLGLCVYHRKTIELSVHFVERNPEAEIRDTILHEIAHALVGPRHGHDRVWKRKCIAIGARPLRCGEAEMPEGHWQAQCGACGRRFQRYRRPKRLRGWFCKTCGPQRGGLIWLAASPRGGPLARRLLTSIIVVRPPFPKVSPRKE